MILYDGDSFTAQNIEKIKTFPIFFISNLHMTWVTEHTKGNFEILFIKLFNFRNNIYIPKYPNYHLKIKIEVWYPKYYQLYMRKSFANFIAFVNLRKNKQHLYSVYRLLWIYENSKVLFILAPIIYIVFFSFHWFNMFLFWVSIKFWIPHSCVRSKTSKLTDL